jgi:hypothetical protein
MIINYLLFVPKNWSSSHNQYNQKPQYSALLNLNGKSVWKNTGMYADIRRFIKLK